MTSYFFLGIFYLESLQTLQTFLIKPPSFPRKRPLQVIGSDFSSPPTDRKASLTSFFQSFFQALGKYTKACLSNLTGFPVKIRCKNVSECQSASLYFFPCSPSHRCTFYLFPPHLLPLVPLHLAFCSIFAGHLSPGFELCVGERLQQPKQGELCCWRRLLKGSQAHGFAPDELEGGRRLPCFRYSWKRDTSESS